MWPQFVPDISKENFDTKHVNDAQWKDADLMPEHQEKLKQDKVQDLFKGYYYNKEELMKPQSARDSTTQGPTKDSTTGMATTQPA